MPETISTSTGTLFADRPADAGTLSIGVLLCTYRRPDNLERCLAGLDQQTRMPDEVIVVVREDDNATLVYLGSRKPESLPLRLAIVSEPGLVAARNAGATVAGADILAITDDDAVPHADWLERIVRHFEEDSRLGGLGGKDQCFFEGVPLASSKDEVGILRWNGNHVGNHHLGRGKAREVDLIKGVNMSYRRTALSNLRFDERLRGKGSQACEDLAMSRAVANEGWKLIYDPEVVVDHYEGERDEPRHYASQLATDATGFKNSVYNQLVAVWSSLSQVQRVVSMIFFFFIGTRAIPGLVQALRFTPSLGRAAWVRFWIAQQARLEAFAAMSRERV